VVEVLLDQGADPSNATVGDGLEAIDGWTALMIASKRGHLGVAKVLLDRGVATNVLATHTGATALLLAAADGHLEIAQQLLMHGADIAAQATLGRFSGLNARGCADSQGHANVVAWFDSVRGWPTFRTALSLSSAIEIRALLRRGAIDPDECGGLIDVVKRETPGSMMTLVKQALGGWARQSHWLYKDAVRLAVATTLMVAYCIGRVQIRAPHAATLATVQAADATSGGCGAVQPRPPRLPPEIWEEILKFLTRGHW
jgi:hypothetical protein